jgi:hypothetical protein
VNQMAERVSAELTFACVQTRLLRVSLKRLISHTFFHR